MTKPPDHADLRAAPAPPRFASPDDAGSRAPGEVEMRIARDGTWYYHGSSIRRKPLVRLFSTVLRREADGGYALVTPVERCPVEVEDAPFVAVEVSVTGRDRGQSLTFRTNVDDRVTADADHPIRVEHDPATGEPRPYVLVRAGLEALIARAVYYELVGLGVEERPSADYLFGVWSEGAFFALGEIDEEDRTP